MNYDKAKALLEQHAPDLHCEDAGKHINVFRTSTPGSRQPFSIMLPNLPLPPPIEYRAAVPEQPATEDRGAIPAQPEVQARTSESQRAEREEELFLQSLKAAGEHL